MAESLITNNDRPTYLPGKREIREEREFVRALPWSGSANLLAYREADCLIVVPPGKIELSPKDCVPTLAIC
jgi:molybdopterin biosynthesis enzyme